MVAGGARTDAVGDRPVRVWARIADALARDIAAGRPAPGDRLPGEQALAERFDVNRHTVRQALKSLADRGLVRVEHGVGSFVGTFAVEYALGRRTRFAENLARAGMSGRHRPIADGRCIADAELARRLGVRAGAALVWVRSRGEANGRPISVSDHYFPARRFAGIAAAFADTGSITRALARCGVADFVRSWSGISAGLPDAETAALLGVPPSRPVLLVESVNADLDGRPVECGRTRFAGDVVQLVVQPES
jgi:GntR family phosphonate transport system transcriptional regulator